MESYSLTIPKAGGGEWPVTVHSGDNEIPADTLAWNPYRKGWKTVGLALAYLKRYGRHHGGAAHWHVIRVVACDGTVTFEIYVG